MMIEKVALFDMDGTLFDYVGAMNASLEKLRAPGEPVVDPFLVKDDSQYAYLWNRMNLIKSQEDWWANLPRLQLGFDVYEMTREIGYFNEILTRISEKNPQCLMGKHRSLRENLGDISYTLTGGDKSRHYGRVLVDDYTGFIEPWLQRRRNGTVIMPVNKYNKGFEHPQVVSYDGTNKEQVREALVAAYNR